MARQTFDQYLAEFRLTQNAVNAVTDTTRDHYGDFGYAAGYFGSMLADVISQLPRAKRQEYRDRLMRKAGEFQVDTLSV